MKKEKSMPKAKHLTVFSEPDQRVHIISVLYCTHLRMKCSLGISNFLEEISSLSHSIVFQFLFTDHWGRLSFLSLLFFGTLHSNVYIFPFLLCLLLLCFSQLFVKPLQAAILPFCISFSWGWSRSLSPEQCHKPQSIVIRHSIRSSPLNLFLTSTV